MELMMFGGDCLFKNRRQKKELLRGNTLLCWYFPWFRCLHSKDYIKPEVYTIYRNNLLQGTLLLTIFPLLSLSKIMRSVFNFGNLNLSSYGSSLALECRFKA